MTDAPMAEEKCWHNVHGYGTIHMQNRPVRPTNWIYRALLRADAYFPDCISLPDNMAGTSLSGTS